MSRDLSSIRRRYQPVSHEFRMETYQAGSFRMGNAILAVLLMLILSSACSDSSSTSDPPTQPGGDTTTTGSANQEVSDDRLRIDSLWRAQVTELPDSVKYGTYTRNERRYYSPQTVHLREDGTFQVVFEDTMTYQDGRVETARAVWTSTWQQVGDVFVVSRDEKRFFAEGEGLRNVGWVDLDFQPETMDSLEIEDTADGMQSVIEELDTCYVRLKPYFLDPTKKTVFLYGTSRANPESLDLPPPRTDDLYYFEYRPGDLSNKFTSNI